ncbi:putative Serine/threonine-protein phosphatase 5 [Paratrimastix pyriformis]|uniref:Serine/threonine-protein phosphatase n=1 Tax=Paratrimastix pyriformis TaxID=342808 RepID=A0ABQ8UD17_9EUKA|nr:putative Serine/threonine-protein phosphatase 5 [Paratrimastix pyriformis]
MFYLWLKGFQHTLLGKGLRIDRGRTARVFLFAFPFFSTHFMKGNGPSPQKPAVSSPVLRNTPSRVMGVPAKPKAVTPRGDEFQLKWPPTPETAADLVQFLKAQKRLKPAQVLKIVDAVRTQLAALPNVLEVEVRDGQDLTVVGDTHGQFYDVLNLFDINGPPSTSNPYLFNGDFVDRGSFGVEIVLTLFMYKLVYPNHVHLLRGNHESQTCTREYGFKAEVEDKYNVSIYNSFMTCFNYLPCCAVINQRTFIVHGGLFNREGVTLQELNRMNRVTEPGEEPGEGLLAQMLWSDPTDMYGRHSSLRPFGCSFGPNVTEEFLGINHLQMIIRSHEVRPNGYSVEHGGKLITVFSAPNYCQDTNQGGYLRLKGQYLDVQFLQFQGVPSPPAKTYFQPPVCLLS